MLLWKLRNLSSQLWISFGLVDKIFNLLLCDSMHQLSGLRHYVRLRKRVEDPLYMDLREAQKVISTCSIIDLMPRTTGVSNSYRFFQCSFFAPITSIWLYSKLRLLYNADSVILASSQREQLGRTKSVTCAVCCIRRGVKSQVVCVVPMQKVENAGRLRLGLAPRHWN